MKGCIATGNGVEMHVSSVKIVGTEFRSNVLLNKTARCCLKISHISVDHCTVKLPDWQKNAINITKTFL